MDLNGTIQSFSQGIVSLSLWLYMFGTDALGNAGIARSTPSFDMDV